MPATGPNTKPMIAYGVRVAKLTTLALIAAPDLASCASCGTTPFMIAKTPVIVRSVQESKPQVRRWLIYFVETSGAEFLPSTFQKITKKTIARTTRTATSVKLAPASLPISLIARYAAKNAMPSVTTPTQSILGVS